MVNSTIHDDIVITGMDGRFPKCKNMEDLGKNLYDKAGIYTKLA